MNTDNASKMAALTSVYKLGLLSDAEYSAKASALFTTIHPLAQSKPERSRQRKQPKKEKAAAAAAVKPAAEPAAGGGRKKQKAAAGGASAPARERPAVVATVAVPAADMGWMIGKRGANLRALRAEFGPAGLRSVEVVDGAGFRLTGAAAAVAAAEAALQSYLTTWINPFERRIDPSDGVASPCFYPNPFSQSLSRRFPRNF